MRRGREAKHVRCAVSNLYNVLCYTAEVAMEPVSRKPFYSIDKYKVDTPRTW